MSILVTICDFSQGGEVSGVLSLLPFSSSSSSSSSSTIDIIASEWAEWLPALSLVPHLLVYV